MGVRQLRANAVEGRDNVLVLYTSGKSCAGLINLAETPVYRLDIQASVPGLAAEMGVDMSFVDRLVSEGFLRPADRAEIYTMIARKYGIELDSIFAA